MSSARSTSLLWEVSLPPNVIEDQETHVCFSRNDRFWVLDYCGYNYGLDGLDFLGADTRCEDRKSRIMICDGMIFELTNLHFSEITQELSDSGTSALAC